MSITKGAAKAHRASLHKRVFNMGRQEVMKDVVKTLRKTIADGNAKKAHELLRDAYQAIDKAAKRGIIKKNTAARKKSRLVTLIKKHSK